MAKKLSVPWRTHSVNRDMSEYPTMGFGSLEFLGVARMTCSFLLHCSIN